MGTSVKGPQVKGLIDFAGLRNHIKYILKSVSSELETTSINASSGCLQRAPIESFFKEVPWVDNKC